MIGGPALYHYMKFACGCFSSMPPAWKQRHCRMCLGNSRRRFGIVSGTCEYTGQLASALCLTFRRRVDNVKVWKAFAAAYGENFRISYGRYAAPVLPHHQLTSVLPYVSEINCAWLTVLSIHGIQVTQCHWMEIGRMSNLVALFVHGDEYCLDSRTVRAWAIGVQECGAFPELRILATEGRCVAVDSSCFDYLAEFPKLEKVRLGLQLSNDQVCGSGWRKLERSEAQTGVRNRMGMNDALAALHDDAIRTKPILVLSTLSRQSLQLPSTWHRNWYERFNMKERKGQQHSNLLQGGSGSEPKQHKIRAGRKRSLHSMLGTF
jgi:hypothetical protein